MNFDTIALEAAREIVALPDHLTGDRRKAHVQCIVLNALQRATTPPPLAWDANENRRYEPVETLAKAIYAAFPFVNDRGELMPGQKPAWAEHGNGLKQDEARHEARKCLRAAGHQPA